MKLSVDRIVEGIAVLEKEDLSRIEIPLSALPSDLKEGTVLLYDGEKYTVDADEEALRRQRILEKQRMLFARGKKD